MLIIAGYMLTNPADRDQLVTAHKKLLERARAADGCLDIAISPDPLDPARVNNFELWADEESLAEWRAVADAPQIAHQITGGAMQKYVIAHTADPFQSPDSRE